MQEKVYIYRIWVTTPGFALRLGQGRKFRQRPVSPDHVSFISSNETWSGETGRACDSRVPDPGSRIQGWGLSPESRIPNPGAAFVT